jgi:hypothetical protein
MDAGDLSKTLGFLSLNFIPGETLPRHKRGDSVGRITSHNLKFRDTVPLPLNNKKSRDSVPFCMKMPKYVYSAFSPLNISVSSA